MQAPEPLSPIERVTIANMTTDEHDAALAQRRERRLSAFAVYQAAEESKKRATDERLRAQLEKQLDMMVKDFVRVDAAIEKLDSRILKVAGIRLELEDYV